MRDADSEKLGAVIELYREANLQQVSLKGLDGSIEFRFVHATFKAWCAQHLGDREVIVALDGTNLQDAKEDDRSPGWIIRGSHTTLIVLNAWVYLKDTGRYSCAENQRKLCKIFSGVLAHEFRHSYQDERMWWLKICTKVLAGAWCLLRLRSLKKFIDESKDGFVDTKKTPFFYAHLDLLERDADWYEQRYSEIFSTFFAFA
jgi:hypothetical protein